MSGNILSTKEAFVGITTAETRLRHSWVTNPFNPFKENRQTNGSCVLYAANPPEPKICQCKAQLFTNVEKYQLLNVVILNQL